MAYIATEDLFRSLLVPQLLLHRHFFLSPDKECIYDYFISPLLLHVVTIAENMDVFTPQLKNGDGSNFECKDEILERCRALKADVFSPQKGIFLFFFGTKTKQEAFQRFENMIRFYSLFYTGGES